MKIVFTATKFDNWNSIINNRFGRSDGFILYDEDEDSLLWHSNEKNINASHGAGIQAGQSVASFEADILLTGGGIGPKAFEVLNKSEIKIYTKVGDVTIKEAYNNFKNGKYSETSSPDK